MVAEGLQMFEYLRRRPGRQVPVVWSSATGYRRRGPADHEQWLDQRSIWTAPESTARCVPHAPQRGGPMKAKCLPGLRKCFQNQNQSKHLFQVGQLQALFNWRKNKTNVMDKSNETTVTRHNNCESTVGCSCLFQNVDLYGDERARISMDTLFKSTCWYKNFRYIIVLRL